MPSRITAQTRRRLNVLLQPLCHTHEGEEVFLQTWRSVLDEVLALGYYVLCVPADEQRTMETGTVETVHPVATGPDGEHVVENTRLVVQRYDRPGGGVEITAYFS